MQNYEIYEQYTKERNWFAICELSNINEQAIRGKKPLLTLHEHLLENEVVFALTHGIAREIKTGNASLVVLTNERFIFLETGMFLKSGSVQSINLENVLAVTAVEGWFTGKLSIDLGARVIRIEPCFKQTASIMVNIANKCIQDIKDRKNANSQENICYEETPLEKLEKLSNLHKMGVLTDEEFNIEKQKLLAKI